MVFRRKQVRLTPDESDDRSPDLLSHLDGLIEREGVRSTWMGVRRISILPVVFKKETLEHGH